MHTENAMRPSPAVSPGRTTNEDKLRDISREFLSQYYTSIGTNDFNVLKQLYGHDSSMKHEGLFGHTDLFEGAENINRALDNTAKRTMRVTVSRYSFIEMRNPASDLVMFHIHVNGDLHMPTEGISRSFTQSFNLSQVSKHLPKKMYILSDIFFWTEPHNAVTFVDNNGGEKAKAAEQPRKEIEKQAQDWNRPPPNHQQHVEPIDSVNRITPPPEEPNAAPPMQQRQTRYNAQQQMPNTQLAAPKKSDDELGQQRTPNKAINVPNDDFLKKQRPGLLKSPMTESAKSPKDKPMPPMNREQLKAPDAAPPATNEATATKEAKPAASAITDSSSAEQSSTATNNQGKSWANIAAAGAAKAVKTTPSAISKPQAAVAPQPSATLKPAPVPNDPVQQQQSVSSTSDTQQQQASVVESSKGVGAANQPDEEGFQEYRTNRAAKSSNYGGSQYQQSDNDGRRQQYEQPKSLAGVRKFFMRFNTPPDAIMNSNSNEPGAVERIFVEYMKRHAGIDLSAPTKPAPPEVREFDAELRCKLNGPKQDNHYSVRLLVFLSLEKHPALAEKIAAMARQNSNPRYSRESPFIISFPNDGNGGNSCMIKEDDNENERQPRFNNGGGTHYSNNRGGGGQHSRGRGRGGGYNNNACYQHQRY